MWKLTSICEVKSGYTKLRKRKMGKGSQRKTKGIDILLQQLSKTKGGRIPNLNTFKIACTEEDAHAKLIGFKSLKSPEETDDFVHVVLKMETRPTTLVAKLQEPGRLLSMELNIQKKLQYQSNIVHYICDFSCIFDSIIWKTPLRAPERFCVEKGTLYHMILMEYIPWDLANFLETQHYDETILQSLVQQVGLSLLEIHINHGISHNDIHRGNVLLDIDTPKDIVYTIGDFTKKVPTHGHEVVWIDFQRGNILEDVDTGTMCQLASDEVSLAFELMSKWVKPEYKDDLQKRMRNVMLSKNIPELLDSICANSSTS